MAAGLPEIRTATAGEFVAQMLNLDCIGGIAWTKGCYTGQEIIARAHYRGQVKRRMRRFAAAAARRPRPAAPGPPATAWRVRVVRSAHSAAVTANCWAWRRWMRNRWTSGPYLTRCHSAGRQEIRTGQSDLGAAAATQLTCH